MAELLFIATTIFVAYVVFVVLGEKKPVPSVDKPVVAKAAEEKPLVADKPIIEKPAADKEVVENAAVEKPIAEKFEKISPTSNIVKSAAKKPARKSVAAKPVADKAATQSAIGNDSVKNPKTGEVAKIPASYAFSKRWIKDALVEEGLLDKVYKNNELDEAATAKIQAALQQLKALDKYN
jgi:hypothetical protein